MKKPAPNDGSGLAESLYSFDGNETDDNLVNPTDTINLVHPRPSIIPGVEYPITDEEERNLDAAWNHFCNLKNRGLL